MIIVQMNNGARHEFEESPTTSVSLRPKEGAGQVVVYTAEGQTHFPWSSVEFVKTGRRPRSGEN